MVLVFDVAHRIPYVISDGGDGDVFPAGCFALIGFASDDLAIAPERGVREKKSGWMGRVNRTRERLFTQFEPGI